MSYQSRLFRYFILLVVLLLLFPIGYGGKMAWDKHTNRVEDWLPESFAETQQLYWFIERFGSDEILMVSWEGCTLSDARLREFTEKLQQPAEYRGKQVEWFRQVWTGPELLETLTSKPIHLEEEEAIRRMQGWLVGPDGKTTCVIGMVSQAGMDNREAAVDYAFSIADAVEGLSRDQIFLAGPTYDGVAINRASKSSLMQFNLWSFLICLVILYYSLKSMRLAGCVFFVALFCQQASMALMYFSGVAMDSVLLLVANLAFVLTTAGGIHMTNYYLDALATQKTDPIGTAISAAFWPTLMSSFTTALGMLSLLVSEITPVRNFGLYAALSVGIVTAALFVILPVLLAQFPPRLPQINMEPAANLQETSPFWDSMAASVTKLRWGLMLLASLLLMYGLYGTQYLHCSARFYDLFSPQARVMQDYRWLESRVGYLVPVEIVVEFPQDDPSKGEEAELAGRFLERMNLVEQMRDRVVKLPGISGSITAADFTPPALETGGVRRFVQHRLRTKMIYDSRQEFHDMGYWRHQDNVELWRISLRVSSGPEVNYGVLLQNLQIEVDELLAEHQFETRPQVLICGAVPLIQKAQTQLLNDLISSFGLAIFMISVTITLLVRNVIVGVLTTLANVIPGLIVFGTMGLLGITVEIGSILTATVALGIAVDDALHFSTWYQLGKRKGLLEQDLLKYAYRHCGAAMVQTSLVCSFGLLIFALSQFMPISRFAWLMFSMMLLALLFNLLVLPAILLINSPPSKKRALTDSIVPEDKPIGDPLQV